MAILLTWWGMTYLSALLIGLCCRGKNLLKVLFQMLPGDAFDKWQAYSL